VKGGSGGISARKKNRSHAGQNTGDYLVKEGAIVRVRSNAKIASKTRLPADQYRPEIDSGISARTCTGYLRRDVEWNL